MAQDPRADVVEITLLGGFAVAVSGRPVAETDWPARRAAELVQLLALAERHRLLRDQVIDALWPHLDPVAGAANLRKAAHHARRALGREDAIVLRGGRVLLAPACQVETDVEGFERAAQHALDSGEPAACAAAAERYAGELLPDSRYEDWAADARERLRMRYLDLLRAAQLWQQVVAAEPTDEAANRALMRAALAAGNPHTAIRWYGRLRTALQREVGMAPGPHSQALYAECVAGLRRVSAQYVGRQVELASAALALQSAGRGRASAVVVRGPAGIGKSAFSRQVAAQADAAGWLTVTVQASADSGPYAALVNLTEQLLGHDPTLLGAAGEQARSTLTALMAPNHATPREDGLTRHMVIGAVHRLLATRSETTGVLLVLDDAHLADDATIDACSHLARTDSLRFLVLATYRAESARATLARVVGELERSGRSTTIDLGPLDRDEIVALVESAAPARPEPEVLERIVTLAQGNPFLALELARGSHPAQQLTVQPSTWGALTARFLGVDDATVQRLRRLAVAGDELDPADVPAITGLDEPDAFALLDAALEAGTLIVADGRYRFRHELVRTALIEQLPPHQRIAIHRDTARRLAAAVAEPALIARHWLEAHQPDEAIGWLIAAARRAIKLGAFADARRHLDTVLDYRPDLTDALILLAETLDALGDPGAPGAYAAAAAQVGEPASHDLWAKQALAQIKLGDPAGALATAVGIEPVTVEGRLAHALMLCGAAALGYADPALGTAKAAECRKLALESGDSAGLVVASWARAAVAHARGDLRESVRTDLLDTHALRDLAVSVFDGQLCIAQRLLYGARPYSDVVAFTDSLAHEAERLGAARGHAFAITIRGEARLLSGQLDEAETDLSEAARENHAIGAATGEAFALQRLAQVALHRGDTAAAAIHIDAALAVARESDVGFHLFDRIYGTKITMAADPSSALAALDEAESAVRGPLETCPGCRITFAAPAAIAAARAGDLDRAARYAETTEWLANIVMRLPAWYAALAEVNGHIALAGGQEAEAAEHFRAAAETFRSAGQLFDEKRCLALVR